MTRYTLRALAAQWRIWSATVAVLALAAVLVNIYLSGRYLKSTNNKVSVIFANLNNNRFIYWCIIPYLLIWVIKT